MTEKITGLIRHPYTPPAGFDAVQPGVHKASTVIFRDVAALRARDWRSKAGYTYGLHGTPTTFTLEERIAALEGGTHCVLAPSGLAAITLLHLALLRQGDEVLLPDNSYAPARDQARSMLAQLGIAHALYDPMAPASLEAAMSSRTKLVWLEAPGSVTMEFPDLHALMAFDPFALGVDLAMHALTKYPSGGADVLMGAITTRDGALHEKILLAHMRTGIGVGANDAELVLRGVPSLAVRYAAHDASARTLATWLGQRRGITHVLHPALPGSPGHEHWKAMCTQAAGLFSVVFDASIASKQVDAFVDALKVFRIGYSWGGPVSLAVPYDLATLRTQPRWTGTLVRFSIGLEAVEDLRADLEQALAASGLA
jgi:cystathionine beta-lyase